MKQIDTTEQERQFRHEKTALKFYLIGRGYHRALESSVLSPLARCSAHPGSAAAAGATTGGGGAAIDPPMQSLRASGQSLVRRGARPAGSAALGSRSSSSPRPCAAVSPSLSASCTSTAGVGTCAEEPARARLSCNHACHPSTEPCNAPARLNRAQLVQQRRVQDLAQVSAAPAVLQGEGGARGGVEGGAGCRRPAHRASRPPAWRLTARKARPVVVPSTLSNFLVILRTAALVAFAYWLRAGVAQSG